VERVELLSCVVGQRVCAVIYCLLLLF
jgi:hypothetical protein